MDRQREGESMMEDPRRLIVRLAVAVMAADGRISADEREILNRLDHLGFGVLTGLVEGEIARAAQWPIDLRATCAGLQALSPHGATVVLNALAELAVCDGTLALEELDA